MGDDVRYLLASRSPRRRELLGLLVPPRQIDVMAPPSANEAGFEGLTTWAEIRQRIGEIAVDKARQVLVQIGTPFRPTLVIAADTTVVVSQDQDGGAELSRQHSLMALGQPPDDNWQPVVKEWFLKHYAARTHWVVTALSLIPPEGPMDTAVVTTSVTFRADVETWLEWYLATGESVGKAGGYAIQGAGSLFVTGLQGSLTNVIGLPLEQLRVMLDKVRSGK